MFARCCNITSINCRTQPTVFFSAAYFFSTPQIVLSTEEILAEATSSSVQELFPPISSKVEKTEMEVLGIHPSNILGNWGRLVFAPKRHGKNMFIFEWNQDLKSCEGNLNRCWKHSPLQLGIFDTFQLKTSPFLSTRQVLEVFTFSIFYRTFCSLTWMRSTSWWITPDPCNPGSQREPSGRRRIVRTGPLEQGTKGNQYEWSLHGHRRSVLVV